MFSKEIWKKFSEELDRKDETQIKKREGIVKNKDQVENDLKNLRWSIENRQTRNIPDIHEKEPELKLKEKEPAGFLPPIEDNKANLTSNLGYDEDLGFTNPMVILNYK